MKKSFYLICAVVFSVFFMSASSLNSEEQKKIIYTTLDVKQNYEVISIIAAPVDISPSFGDPVAKAYKAAWEQFMKTATSIGADAVVGVRIELQNMNGQIVGRLLIYGTAVKFITE